MLRLGKLSDYGTQVITHVAAHPHDWQSATEIAHKVILPVPTVIKVLKRLMHGGLLESRRGALGGYRLAAKPKDITLESILTVLEEPLALVSCLGDQCNCSLTDTCQLHTFWERVNQSIRWTLAGITLEEIVNQPSRTLDLASLEKE